MKIGLQVDTNFVNKYVLDLVKWSFQQKNIEISHLIVQQDIETKNNFIKRKINLLKKYGLVNFLEQVFYSLIVKFESILLNRYLEHKNHFTKYDINEYVPNAIFVKPEISKNGYIYRYKKNDLDKIKKLNLDIILRCGSGILQGEILNLTKFGIISFHHGNNEINRGGPPGFWEVYYKDDTTGFMIQQLTEELDGGNVFSDGEFQTQYFYSLNQAFLYTKSNYYMKETLKNISYNNELPKIKDKIPYFNPLFKRPNLFKQLNYSINLFFRILKKILRKYIQQKHYRWGVAFTKQNWQNIIFRKAKKIINPPGCFLADPFLISKLNRDFCFVEEYSYNNKKAHISVYELINDNYSRLGIALEENFHLSFPHIFEYQEKIYMCPDTSQKKEIRIYQCNEFPLKWSLSKILMKNINAADSMIFEYNDLWWLFSNIDLSNIGDHGSELSIFYSKTGPLTDKWTPHNLNPVIINSKKARNGGLIFHENKLYRVSQKQGFDMYGENFQINKIINLNINEYKEKKYFSVKPNFFKNIIGTHHFHTNLNYTAFDFVKLSKIN